MYKIDKQQGLTISYRELYSESCNNLYWERMKKKRYYTCICITESLFCMPEINTIL